MSQQRSPVTDWLVVGVAGWLMLLWPGSTYAVEVAESSLSRDAVVVELTGAEGALATESRSECARLGAETARKMIALAGVPESFSGKVASLGVWTTLTAKYAQDIRSAARQAPQGYMIALKYRVNIEGVRRVWHSSGAADHVLPGSDLTRVFVTIVNEFINGVLR